MADVTVSDRVCIRGCKVRGLHYAACEEQAKVQAAEAAGEVYVSKCWGCAERPARDHALICDSCFYRLRTLVRDSGDLYGRLRSLADPMKATPTDKAPGGRAQQVEAPAPVDADLLDALNDLGHTLHDWGRHTDYQLERCLPDLVNDVENVRILGIGFLDRNPLVDGVRPFWSVQDAVDKWGVERRTKGEPSWEADPDPVVVAIARPEWSDPLITKLQAEQLAGSERTLRRWIGKGLIEHEGTVVIAGVMTRMFRRGDVVRVRDEMQSRVGRPKTTENGGAS
ncbi:MAG: hypothetical protein BGN97_00340 [Microbacterium sp. 69-10]|uniref:hypothetical protein n=1 Tax=Microbacterium sp. 69-10 TaxID=1895783 RepID=UPI000966BAC0|nr:hypothetical protein [Microbacterium sp. 69-10]OJU39703.1 MAG: hypothetical protein BGN97_00340 [Microbacterium sp. 69-10]